MSRHTLRLTLLTIFTLLLALLILTDLVPLLRGPAPGSSEWYWPYELRPFSRWWLPIIAALLLLTIVSWWLKRPHHTKPALLALVLANLLLQLGLVYAERPSILAELVNRTLSEETTGYFQPAAEITTLDAFLTDFPAKMPQFASEHARTHPPGLILLNWLAIRAFSLIPSIAETVAQQIRPLRCTDLWLLQQPPPVVAGLALAAVLPLLLGALTILPGFLLAQRLLPPSAAQLAAALIATLPALLIFAPNSVQIDAFLVVLIMLSLALGVQGSGGWFFAGGLLFSAATFLSLGNAALLLPLAAFIVGPHAGTIGRLLQRPSDKPTNWQGWLPLRIWRSLLAFGLGAAVLWLLLWLLWGVPPWEIARAGLEQHYHLVTAERRYQWWLLYNLIDLMLFAGLPFIIGFVGALWLVGRRLRSQAIGPVVPLALGLALLILLLDLSGSTRGEVGRLWLFFMPLLAFPTAAYLEQALPGHRRRILIIALQLLLTLAIGLAWEPISAVIVVAERPPMPAADPTTPLNITLLEPENGVPLIQLTGFDAQTQPGESIDLTLYWQAIRPSQRPYTVFNHLLDSQGSVVAQKDNWPVNGQWPPTCWQTGEKITDPYHIQLPPNLPPGQYSLVTGLYDAANSQRLVDEDKNDGIEILTILIQE